MLQSLRKKKCEEIEKNEKKWKEWEEWKVYSFHSFDFFSFLSLLGPIFNGSFIYFQVRQYIKSISNMHQDEPPSAVGRVVCPKLTKRSFMGRQQWVLIECG